MLVEKKIFTIDFNTFFIYYASACAVTIQTGYLFITLLFFYICPNDIFSIAANISAIKTVVKYI